VTYDQNTNQESRFSNINIKSDFVSEIVRVEQNADTFVEDNDLFKDKEFTIYPNPTTNKFYIKSDKKIDSEFDLAIYDVTGKIVFLTRVNELLADQPLEVDISYLLSGMYIIKLNNLKIYALKKVLKN